MYHNTVHKQSTHTFATMLLHGAIGKAPVHVKKFRNSVCEAGLLLGGNVGVELEDSPYIGAG
jgi:hypothetical protein